MFRLGGAESPAYVRYTNTGKTAALAADLLCK